MSPMGISLKQQVQSVVPFAPCVFDAAHLLFYGLGANSTLGEIGGGSWPGCGSGGAGPFNGSVSGAYTTSTWNGHQTVGNSTTRFQSTSGSTPSCGASLVTGFAGADATDMTLYFVVQMTDMTTPGEPGYGMFQYGTHDGTFGNTQEKELQIEFFSSPQSFSIVDTTGVIGATDLYSDNYTMPASMVAMQAGVLTLQTSRNSNHRARWQQVDITTNGTTHTGTVQNFTSPNFMYIGALNTTTNIITSDSSFGDCYIGAFFIYNTLHNNSQINQVEGYLRTFWGI